MGKKNISIQVGPGGATCLVILLAILKTQNYLNISWLWVFAPYWLGLAILLAVLAFAFLVVLIASGVK